jgi:hypothetical protein
MVLTTVYISNIALDHLILRPKSFQKSIGWDIAMVSWFADGGDYTALKWQPINQYWAKLKGGNVWGTGCYVLNGAKGAENLLKCILPINSHIDRMFNESAKQGMLNSYFMKDRLSHPDWSFPSQIRIV